jgi:transcriptional regulator with XRE-family HTH domain
MKHKPDFIDREIGRRLRVARIAANVRQYRAAKAVGVTYQQIRKYEVGYNRVSAVIVARLAQVYQRPVGWFLEGVTLREDGKTDPLTDSIARTDFHHRANEASDRPEQAGH